MDFDRLQVQLEDLVLSRMGAVLAFLPSKLFSFELRMTSSVNCGLVSNSACNTGFQASMHVASVAGEKPLAGALVKWASKATALEQRADGYDR